MILALSLLIGLCGILALWIVRERNHKLGLRRENNQLLKERSELLSEQRGSALRSLKMAVMEREVAVKAAVEKQLAEYKTRLENARKALENPLEPGKPE